MGAAFVTTREHEVNQAGSVSKHWTAELNTASLHEHPKFAPGQTEQQALTALLEKHAIEATNVIVVNENGIRRNTQTR